MESRDVRIVEFLVHDRIYDVQRRGSESYWPVRRLIYRPETKTGSVWSRRQTSKWCTGKPDPLNLYQGEGWWPALAGVETCQWSTTHHLDPPDLSWHGCYSDWVPAASGGHIAMAGGFGWSLRVTTTTTTTWISKFWFVVKKLWFDYYTETKYKTVHLNVKAAIDVLHQKETCEIYTPKTNAIKNLWATW